MHSKDSKNKVQSYITMAQSGHFPLFFKEWLESYGLNEKKISYKSAKSNLKSSFKKLERHKTLSKKKTALISMDENERQELIASFVKMVEYNTLKDNKVLH